MNNDPIVTVELVSTIKEQVRISWSGAHGIRHWARVYDIGLRLAEQTGANQNVVQLFAVFHDSRRLNEHHDPGHGPRGGELAIQLRKAHFPSLTDKELELLHQACCLHTSASTHEDITVQTCFDSDRLDLGRVGKVPDPDLLCTDAAKSDKILNWAYKRSVDRDVPDNTLGKFVS
jgi:uncharacterized protein